MPRYDYNIAVIGAGSGGLVAAYIAAAVKAKVVLIEKDKMGGDCLNTGCVPSKALICSAKIYAYGKRGKEFGLEESQLDFNFENVMARVHKIIKTIAPHDSVARYQALGVDCIQGAATITSPHSISVGNQVIRAKAIIVASGARPLVPAIEGLEKINYFTSDNIWQLTTRPKKLLVLGGGPIGCEMAQAFARLGAKVTLVEQANQLLIREDEAVIDLLTTRLKQEGVTILTGHTAKSFKLGQLTCRYNKQSVTVDFDTVLLALGRRANITGFGLAELGVNIRQNQTIDANAFLQTNIKSIYVCGDVTGPYQFTHTAAHQAWYACVNALFSPLKKFKVDYRVIPWATFTDPEIARVGLNEKEAKANNIAYEVSHYGIDDLDRAIADSEAHGFIKVLTVPNKDKIIGVTIVCSHAGDLIAEYILAMKHNIGLNKILATIHIYPTLAEANKYVAGQWKKNHVPKLAMKLLEKFHTWRR